ncbi:MAG: NUDIX hydrolase [bacterium]|nr:NUDIX hydrolase [bacterium]
MQEKIVSTQTLYDGRIVKLDLHEVELPNGQHSKREIVRHPGAVAVVAFDTEGKVLLVRQYRTAAGKVLLEIPAGTLNPNEPPLDCAVRELQEETGYRPGKIDSMGGIYTAPGYTTEFIHLFLATDLSESRLQADDDEFIEVVRLPLPEALHRIEQGEIVDAKTTSGLLLASRKMGAS